MRSVPARRARSWASGAKRWTAPAAFVGYIAISLVLDDVVPFCTFAMFSAPNAAEEVWTLSFRADGEPALIFKLKDFSMSGLSRVYPGDYHDYAAPGGDSNLKPFELYSYIAKHPAPPDAPPGPVRVEIARETSRWDAHRGAATRDVEVLSRGTARWR